jgi:hypothetical protein
MTLKANGEQKNTNSSKVLQSQRLNIFKVIELLNITSVCMRER